jgi:hypothetical protein
MKTDYRPILEAAHELLHYSGYLDTQGKKEQSAAQSQFNGERRKLVYELLKQTDDHEALIATVSADMDRMAANSMDHSHAAIEEVRSELIKHIRRQASNGPFMRFITRWGPPAVAASAIAAYVAFRMYV